MVLERFCEIFTFPNIYIFFTYILQYILICYSSIENKNKLTSEKLKMLSFDEAVHRQSKIYHDLLVMCFLFSGDQYLLITKSLQSKYRNCA